MLKHSFNVLLTLSLAGFVYTSVSSAQTPIKTVAVISRDEGSAAYSTVDGVVEAVRQTTIASQVPASVLSISVKAGDSVKAGQILIQLDGKSALEGVNASNAQLGAAQANLNVAAKDLERKRQLYQKQYLSQSALEKAQTQFDAAQAQVISLQAQVGVAKNQSNFFIITAPYDGVVSDVNVSQGDMALPGKSLANLYDPKNLRIKAFVSQTTKKALGSNANIDYEITDLPTSLGVQKAGAFQWIPNLDPISHSLELRIPLQNNSFGAMPGMFAKVILPIGSQNESRLFIPKSSLVVRSELIGVYVVKPNTSPVLRQIKIGEHRSDTVEVLSGLSKGELIAVDPQAAAKVH